MEKKKFKLLKVILLVVLLIILVVLVNSIRNFIIISDLQNKVAEYENSSNYHKKTITAKKDGSVITTDNYKKDDKNALFVETNNSGEISKILMYNNGERTDVFIETKESKTVTIDSGMSINLNVSNYLKTDGALQTFLACLPAKVRSVEYKDKVCYSIENFFTSGVMYGTEKNEIYVDKETGLVLFKNTDGELTEKEYEFNNVDDLIFVEPNIGEYKLIEAE